MCSFVMLLGRICLSAIFILAGVGKFMDFHGTAEYMASKGLTMIPVFLYAAAILEIVGGLSLLLGLKVRWGATILMLFVVSATVIFHDFWNVTDPILQKLQMIMFMKNLAILGGLLYVVSCGAGGCACDACCCKK